MFLTVPLSSTYRFFQPSATSHSKIENGFLVRLRHVFLLKSETKAIWKGRWEGRTGLTSSLTATFLGQIGFRNKYTQNLGTNSLKLSVPSDPLAIFSDPQEKAYSRQKYYTSKIQSRLKISPDEELFFSFFLTKILLLL